ncbi:MAG TPA: nickel-responsive transcriptional regulator NikR [Methylomirabilota bacterium]|jgi:CopG family nickel-responsive transcriptional regulator|nr:nickel-responsive transcriptional regulator NikR [Methylomirabilota bacterium]HEX3178732.1 nickel-responsive transcriptional regulator NikR [Methylomirabilota bacterium]
MRTLDALRAGRRYANRSEFVRDMLRGELVKREWRGQKGETVGVLVLVHDHDTRALADKLTDIQHHSRAVVVSALHVHLNAHMCLEVVPLRGTSVRGVRYGQLVPATTGAELT